MGRGGRAKQKIFRYFMGLHFGVCYGPVDRFLAFICGDRPAWTGIADTNGTISVNAPDLFGGLRAEGGIQGKLTVMMGGPTQTLPIAVQAALPAQPPAFRGVFSLFYDGLISTNNPYVKPMAFQVERIKAGWSGGSAWYEGKAAIPVGGTILSHAEGADELDQWTLVSGNVVFENLTNDYGLVFNCIPQNSVVSSIVSKDLELEFVPEHVSFYFMVTSSNSDDAALLSVGDWFTLNPRREGAYDAGRRCWLYIAGETVFVDALTIGEWYRFSLAVDDGTAHWEIRRAGDDYLQGSGTKTAAVFATAPAYLKFTEDSGGLTCPTQYAGITMTGDSQAALYGMNPAHIIYQCLTDPQWGMGYPSASIDAASFTTAADTLYNEGLGLCLLWNKSDEIGAFVRQVLDHAGALLYTDPQTGKFKLKLLRADYVAGTLPVFDTSNITSFDSFQRVGYGDTVNEIVVVYRDVDRNADVPVAVQNLANIQAQGGVVSQRREYPGLPNERLALRIAQRDLDASSTPLAKARLKINRTGSTLTPGAVFALSWPKLGLVGVIMRVLGIDGGTLDDGEITIDCAEDVFGLPASSYAEQEPPGWVAPSADPQPIARQAMIEAPYYLLAHGMDASALAALDADAAYFAALAGRPTALSLGFSIQSRVGAAEYAESATGLFVPAGSLAVAVDQAAASIALTSPTELDRMAAGMLAVVGTGRAAEIMRINAVDADSATLSVARGVLDTTPRDHAAGEPVFVIAGDGSEPRDQIERATGEEIDYKLLPQTTGAQLAIALATKMTVQAAQRQMRPLAPGNLLVNGVMYPASVSDAITLTWAHRNRLQQTEGIVLQTDASITPETGTTYSVWVFDDETAAQLLRVDGIAEQTCVLAVAAGSMLRVEVAAVRGGLESWHRQVRRFAYVGDLVLVESGDLLKMESGALCSQEKREVPWQGINLGWNGAFIGAYGGTLYVGPQPVGHDAFLYASGDDGETFSAIQNIGAAKWATMDGGIFTLPAQLGSAKYAVIAQSTAGTEDAWQVTGELSDILGTVARSGSEATGDRLLAGRPRTSGGDYVRVYAFGTDGSGYYVIGAYPASGALRAFSAGADLVLTDLGAISQNAADPHPAAGFENAWPNFIANMPIGPGSLCKFGSRWFLRSMTGIYFNDDITVLDGWLRCVTGLGDGTTTPNIIFLDILQIGSTLLFFDGRMNMRGISVSTDNGDTCTPVLGGGVINMGQLRYPVARGSQAVVYDLAYGKVLTSSAPFTSWTETALSLPAGVSGFLRVRASGSNVVAITLDGRLIYSTDGIHFSFSRSA